MLQTGSPDGSIQGEPSRRKVNAVMVEQLRHREFIGYQVYMTQRTLAKSLDQTLSPFGLTSGQWNALNQLNENGAMTQKELADILKKEPATVARLLDRLVRNELVKRLPHPEDRRANIIEITPKAISLLEEVEPVVVARADLIAKGITDKDLDTFFNVLNLVRKNALKTIGE